MKQGLKLFCKCILVIMPFLAMVIYCMLCSRNFMDSEEAPYYLWNKEVSNTSQDKYYDVVILGDSTANSAYLPEILSDSTISLALGGTTPMENYYTLYDWLAHHEAPRVCYMSYMDHHMKAEDCFWNRIMFTHRYTLSQSVEMLRAAIRYQEPSILSDNYIADFLSYQLWLPNKYISPLMNASFNQRYLGNIGAWQVATLHGGRYMGLTAVEYTPSETLVYDLFSTAPMFDEYYRKTIELCIENGIQVRVVHLPYAYEGTFTDEFNTLFQNYYDALKNDYPGLTVDWFGHYKGTYYTGDVAHMNNHGALCFSEELKKLHPEDFGAEPISGEQIAGINDYIIQELDLPYVFDWVAGRGYTVLLDDLQGRIPAMYGSEIRTNFSDILLTIAPMGAGQTPEGESIYAVVDDGRTTDAAVFRAEDGTLMVQTAGVEPVPWDVKPGADIGVLVIDSFGRIVCTKSFDYTEGPEVALIP